MGWLSIIMAVITYGPKIFALVSELLDLIKKIKDPQKQEAFAVEVKRAAAVAKATGDRRPLRELRERIYRCCDDERPGPRAA